MSDTTSDTSAIDAANENSNTNTPAAAVSSFASNIKKFIISVITIILVIVIYFSYSGLILYGCKLAQSNILPTEEKCYPYSDKKPDIQQIQTNIFTTFTDPQLSMKMSFPYNGYNSSNKVLDLFRNYKEEYNSNFMANYFISIIEKLILDNYSVINFVANMMNGLPEIVILIFGPFIVSVISTLVFLYDHLYVMYLWFANMGWFFKKNTNEDVNKRPVWEDVTWTQPLDYVSAIGLVILFCFLFWALVLTLPVLPFLTMAWCLFTCIVYEAEMGGKQITSLNIIKDLFKYYKVTFMSIFSFFVIVSAFGSLGTIPGIFAIATLAFIYFGIITIDLFKPNNEEGLGILTSYKQAKKTCNLQGTNLNAVKKEKHGLLYNLIFGQKGGSISKELKNIGKKISTK
jgi:hypothetical protein